MFATKTKPMSKFINPALVVAQTPLGRGMTVADLGCGSGFYVLPAAQLVGSEGTVIAVDMDEKKLEATASAANQFGYKNVRVLQADLEKPLVDIPENSIDLVILGNILHSVKNKEALLRNAYRIMGTDCGLLVVEWKRGLTPFGPPISKRVDQTQLQILLMQMGLTKVQDLEADGYHYAVLFRK
jgi:ubiquinone/menaquinone biosynthesis C-methylase UbiE